MNARPSSLLRRTLLAAFCAALFVVSTAYAVNHNPTQSGDSISESDISIESVKGQIQDDGKVKVTLKIKEENKKNDGGLAVKDAVVRFFIKDEKGNEVPSGDGDFKGVEGEQEYTISDGCGCAFTVKLFGFDGELEVEADKKEDVKPTTPGAPGQGGGSNGSINVTYSLGKNTAGGGAEIYLLSSGPNPDLYSPDGLQISGTATITRDNGVLDVIETDQGRTEVKDIGPNGYKLKFYNKANNALIKTVEFANPGGTTIDDTVDQALYQSERWGTDFTYAISVQSGPCVLEFNFAELYHDQIGASVFDVSAEGLVVLDNYDPLAAAGSRSTAQVETASALVADGELNLSFDSVVYGAHVSAFKAVRAAEPIAETDDDELFQSARSGDFSYQFALPNGDYEVSLYFAEPAFAEDGKRVFDVSAQGALVLEDFDIHAEALARATALVKTIPVTVANGELQLDLMSSTEEARLCAIKVVDVTTSTTALAINSGGDAFTASDSTEFVADIGYIDGDADYPGRLLVAINAGGADFLADGNVLYEADDHYERGRIYLGTNNRLLVTDTPANGTAITYDYTWFTIPHTGEFGECVLSFAGGLKKEGKQEIWSQDQQSYDAIHTFRGVSNNLLSKTVTTHEVFPFGTRPVAEVIDPEGAALTTTWTYIEGSGNPSDPKPDGYGEAQRMVRHDGYWEDYQYNAQGRRTKTISQYLDSVVGDEVNSRVETFAYSTTNPIRTTVTTIQGQEVARTYEVEINDTDNHERERKTITAVTPGAAYDAADNLVSVTRTYTSEHSNPLYRGRTKWTRSPDGTMTVYAYSQSGTDRIVIRETGAYDAISGEIEAGTRTITRTNDRGHQVEEEVKDIASGLTLTHWVALIIDDFGRPTLFGYDDGTTREIAYQGSDSSCGTCSGSASYLVDYEIDRNGVRTDYAYDALGRRTETTRLGVTQRAVLDALGRTIASYRIAWDGPLDNGQPTEGTTFRTSATTYDIAGRVESTFDQVATVKYDEYDQLVILEPVPAGNETTYAYDYPTGGGMITTITSPATTAGSGTRVETTYADGRTKEISGTAVSPIKYAYGTWSAAGQAGEWTQQIKVGDIDTGTGLPAETEWTKTYTDLARRTVRMEYSDAAEATMTYNLAGQLARQTDPDGVTTLYAYNAEGEREVTAIDMDRDGEIDYLGTEDPFFAGDRITKTTRDVYSRDGTYVRRTTTQVWGTDIDDTATTVSTTEQDGYGNQSWQTDIDGNETKTITARSGAGEWTVTTTRPDTSSQVQAYEDGRLATSTTYTSSSTLVTQTTFGYDAHGRVATQTDARTGATTYAYTGRDEVLSVTSNNGTETTTYAYDALGNQLTITRPSTVENGVTIPHVTTNEYYLRNNQLKKVSGSLTYPVEYTYDPQGRMKTLTTWQNATSSTGAAVTTWNYDSQRGWLTEKLYDDTGPAYAYTDAGRLLTRTWVRTISSAALVTTYDYDNAGQLTSTDYSDTTPDVTITYDRLGRQKTVTDATGERIFDYDETTLRLESEALSSYYGDRILTRSYQVAAGVNPLVVPGRPDGFELGLNGDPLPAPEYSVVYGYDTAGRLSTVTDPSSLYTYAYTPNSNLRHTLTGPVHVATITYEDYRDVIDILENKVGSTSISKYDYTVNSLGQRTQRVNTGSAFGTTSTDEFSYNAKGEVTGTTNATIPAYDRTFAYDDIGNRTTATDNVGTTNYTANSLNQYTQVSAFSSQPSYDSDGNQLTTGTGQVYTWDAENRLINVEPALPLTSDLKQVNTYDGQSRRVRKQVYTYTGSAWSLTTDEKFIYDGWNVVAVLNAASSNALLRTYTWGTDLSGSLQAAGGVGGLLATSEINSGAISATYHYTYDANGNVSEVLNNSGGIAAHYEYDAFGNTVTSSGTYASTNLYRFSTKPLDSVSELYYYGFRYYNPSTGRWPSRDPIGERGGLNLYGFIRNNPIKGNDYLGLALTAHSGGYVVGASLPGPIRPGAVGGTTDDNWYDIDIAKRSGKKVSISGSLTITVRFIEGSNPDVTRGADGRTLREHEEEHVRITSDWWNNLKEVADTVEGTYCSAKCARIVVKAARALSYHNYYSSAITNLDFDIEAYGHPAARRGEYIGYVNEYRSELAELEQDYLGAGCQKM